MLVRKSAIKFDLSSSLVIACCVFLLIKCLCLTALVCLVILQRCLQTVQFSLSEASFIEQVLHNYIHNAHPTPFVILLSFIFLNFGKLVPCVLNRDLY